MAERRRGTQGRPMIYGKTPGSRRYWNIEPENAREAKGNQAQTGKKDTEKTSENRETKDQKTVLKDKKRADSSKNGNRPEEARYPEANAEPPASGEHRRKRARSYGEQMKLHALWTAFGVLCVLLVVAIIYEIILGNGTKLPGSERITQPTRQEQNRVTTGITLQKNQTEAVQTENAVQTEAAAQTGGAQTETETQTGESVGRDTQTGGASL